MSDDQGKAKLLSLSHRAASRPMTIRVILASFAETNSNRLLSIAPAEHGVPHIFGKKEEPATQYQ
jgi:hypothetical protein